MAQVTIRADVDEVVEALHELGVKDATNAKYILSAIGREGAKIAKRSYLTSGLQRRSGNLYKSIKSWTSHRGLTAYVGAKREKNTVADFKAGKGQYKNEISYGYMLTHDFRVDAKKHVTKDGRKVMQFLSSDGHWVTTEGFNVKSRDYVEGPVRSWMHSASYRNKLDSLLETRTRKIMEKKRK